MPFLIKYIMCGVPVPVREALYDYLQRNFINYR